MEANLKRLAEENAGLATEATALRARLDRVHARLANLPPQPQRSNTKAKTAAPTQSKETPVSRVPANAKQPSSAGSGAGAETTERLYFADTYAFTAEASVVAVAEADGKHVLILDKTVFHPQGGGQPADTGRITGKGWAFEVAHVASRPDGVIEHVGTFGASGPADTESVVGEKVRLEVDESARRLHARLHSAGHLLDAALVNLGRTDLEPGKGYHFTAGPYVEYIGAVSADDKDSLAAAVSAECQRLIDAAILTVVTEEVDPATGAASRVVNVGGCTCPCGGTHVQNTAEIVSITVTRIKKVKKNVKVSMSTTHLYLP